MKTHIIYLTLLFCFCNSTIIAQQEKTIRVHQVGISFSSLDYFGMHYKTGGEKTLLRLTFLSLNTDLSSSWGRPQDSIDMSSQHYGAGFRLGFEKRVPIVSKLDFIWGLETGCNYNYQKQKIESIYINNKDESISWGITPMIDLILGITYLISDHLVIGAEITPGISYTFGKTKNTMNSPYSSRQTEVTNSDFHFGFSNGAACLTLAYRFGK